MTRAKLIYFEEETNPAYQSIIDVPETISPGHLIKQYRKDGWSLHEVVNVIIVAGEKHGDPKLELTLVFVEDSEIEEEK